MVQYHKIMARVVPSKCLKHDITRYYKKSLLLCGAEWLKLIKNISEIIKSRKSLNGAPKKMSYKQLKGSLAAAAIGAGLGHVKGTPDTYHGIIYKLVKNYGLSFHKIVTTTCTTDWLILETDQK